MSKTFEQGREEVAKLCKYFADNRQDFFAPGVKEAHVRQSLIDPFFEALGWDMRNAAMTALQYREVIPEDSLEIEGQQKAPDYTFRVGTLAKFYTEAKKCGVNINADPGPAYQLRRYGWSAKVPLSILTDFEELGVYDCSLRPRPTDKASFGRIQYFRDEEYPDRWRELWDIFSREAVWAGAYDRYAASKRKRGTSEVDSEFLKEIEGWRDSLARNIAMRNLYLGYDDLNTAVQRTIDRLIFLRMAEDRGSESYGQLLKLCERPDIYARFVGDLCRKADEKYNSGIFHFQKEDGVSEQHDRLTPALTIDDKIIKPILQSLYFENGSPYHFGVLPVEILGTVYERFLGKVIRLTHDHRAKVEEKPEVRKAGGVYYTPAYIVNYIVTNTVGKMIEGKSPAQLAGGKSGQPLRVLDMACGSGSFLLGAYQCLLDHSLKWYLENRPEKHKEAVYFDGRRKFWRLNITEKKRILISHIFGVDIDLQAVEVSKLSLLLKVLEGETDETVGQSRQLFHERALPNLSNNIKCGNSLIGPDYFSGRLIPDPDEMKRVNPFDWNREFPEVMKSGGFDCVIGNPPYVRQEALGEFKKYFQEHYEVYNGVADLYSYFIEHGVSLLKNSGIFSYIVANKWMRANYGEPLRKWLKKQHIDEIIDFGDLPVFQTATTYPCILRIAKENPKTNFNVSQIKTLSFPNLSDYVKDCRYQINRQKLDDKSWSLSDNKTQELVAKISAKGISLGEYVSKKIFYGIKTGLNEAFVIDEETKKRLIREDSKSAELIKPFLAGRDIKRYEPPGSGKYLILIPKGWTRKRSSGINDAFGWLMKNYPSLANHLLPFAEAAEKRFDKGEYWWELRACDYYEEFEKPKIMLPDISLRGNFILDHNSNCYCVNTAYIISSFNPYLLGILNSKLMTFFYKNLSSEYRGGYLRFIYQYLIQLPIHPITNPKEISCSEKIVKLVESMLDLHKKKTAALGERDNELIQRQIDATDHEIDRLVYELYGVTEEEIVIIEGK